MTSTLRARPGPNIPLSTPQASTRPRNGAEIAVGAPRKETTLETPIRRRPGVSTTPNMAGHEASADYHAVYRQQRRGMADPYACVRGSITLRLPKQTWPTGWPTRIARRRGRLLSYDDKSILSDRGYRP